MIWQKDRFRPTQPYYVFDMEDFHQEIYLKEGLSHFYCYHKAAGCPIKMVPDACIDILFEFGDDGMKAFACGSPLSFELIERPDGYEVFGVRFMPGVHPKLLNCQMRDLLDTRIPLEEILTIDSDWMQALEREKDFYKRIQIFLEAYNSVFDDDDKPFGKKELVQSVKRMVYESDGLIQISQLQEKTGYSARYINKVFIEEMGFSPKTFCEIIRFQRALEFLNYGAPDKMTEAAVYLGYYDQAQFIHDFKKNAGTTPKRYLKQVEELQYKNRIIQKI